MNNYIIDSFLSNCTRRLTYYLFILFMKTRIEVVTRSGDPQVYQQVISFDPGHYFNYVPRAALCHKIWLIVLLAYCFIDMRFFV